MPDGAEAADEHVVQFCGEWAGSERRCGGMAHEFEEYRPWRSYAQFEKEIGKYVDAKEVSRLKRYVMIDEPKADAAGEAKPAESPKNGG